jgi:hypothetical protein
MQEHSESVRAVPRDPHPSSVCVHAIPNQICLRRAAAAGRAEHQRKHAGEGGLLLHGLLCGSHPHPVAVPSARVLPEGEERGFEDEFDSLKDYVIYDGSLFLRCVIKIILFLKD